MVAPISMPSNYFAAASYDLRRYTSRNELYGGVTQVREQGEPRWMAQYRTAPLTEIERRTWRGFWDRLKGGLVTFLGYDPAQSVPAAYADTGIMPGGYNGITSISNISANQLTIGGLPAGFVLSNGDLIELAQGDNHAVHRITVANPPGTTIIVAVEPAVRTAVYTTPSGNLRNPGCNMIAIPDSWSYMAEAGSYPGATFSAIQKIA